MHCKRTAQGPAAAAEQKRSMAFNVGEPETGEPGIRETVIYRLWFIWAVWLAQSAVQDKAVSLLGFTSDYHVVYFQLTHQKRLHVYTRHM